MFHLGALTIGELHRKLDRTGLQLVNTTPNWRDGSGWPHGKASPVDCRPIDLASVRCQN